MDRYYPYVCCNGRSFSKAAEAKSVQKPRHLPRLTRRGINYERSCWLLPLNLTRTVSGAKVLICEPVAILTLFMMRLYGVEGNKIIIIILYNF